MLLTAVSQVGYSDEHIANIAQCNHLTLHLGATGADF